MRGVEKRPDFETIQKEWRVEIDRRLGSLITEQRPDILYKPMAYVFEGGGKRIRPILLLASGLAVGGDIDDFWDAALAMEMLHNFTLVHDDIMDDDDTRRGRPTLHKKWNENISLLAGDGILALAYRSLIKAPGGGSPEIINLFTEGLIELCEGQALDLEFEKRSDVTPEEYIEMIGKKTACLLRVSAEIGAILGGGTETEIKALGDFASNLGCAFQIQDDMLDIVSDEVTLGKTYGSDIKQKKKTYLLIHALNNLESERKTNLLELMTGSANDISKIHKVRGIFTEAGSIDSAESAIQMYLHSARENLNTLSSSQTFLHHFLNYISSRNA